MGLWQEWTWMERSPSVTSLTPSSPGGLRFRMSAWTCESMVMPSVSSKRSTCSGSSSRTMSRKFLPSLPMPASRSLHDSQCISFSVILAMRRSGMMSAQYSLHGFRQ